jgi:hypothetical protein
MMAHCRWPSAPPLESITAEASEQPAPEASSQREVASAMPIIAEASEQPAPAASSQQLVEAQLDNDLWKGTALTGSADPPVEAKAPPVVAAANVLKVKFKGPPVVAAANVLIVKKPLMVKQPPAEIVARQKAAAMGKSPPMNWRESP